MFARSIGSAVGVAIFGAIANAILASSGDGTRTPALVTEAGTSVFIAVLVCAVVTVLAGLAMPRARVEDIEHVASVSE